MIIIIFSTASLHSIFFQYTDSRRQRSLRFSTLQRSFHILKVTFYHLSAQRFIKYFRLFVGTVHKSNSFSLNTMYNLQHLKFIFHTIVVTHKHLVISTLSKIQPRLGSMFVFSNRFLVQVYSKMSWRAALLSRCHRLLGHEAQFY